MTKAEEMLQYLEREPRARERVNKNRAIVNVLLPHYPTLKDIEKDVLVLFVMESNSLDRSWRKMLEVHPLLRGTDYAKKDELEREKQQELGYNV